MTRQTIAFTFLLIASFTGHAGATTYIAPGQAAQTPEAAPVPEPEVAERAEEPTAPIESDPIPSPSPTPSQGTKPAGFTLRLVPGEALSLQIIRQAPPEYRPPNGQIIWSSKDDLPVAAFATIEADNFDDALLITLQALWRTEMPLYVDHYSNNVIIIQDY